MSGDYLQAYREAVDMHGAGFAATLWGSGRTQSLRFSVMADLVGDLPTGTVLDLGCGDGGLSRWMIDTGHSPLALHGIDAIPEQVAATTANAPKWATYTTADLLDQAVPWPNLDWAVVSGTLNTMSHDDSQAILDRAWDSCRIGLAFNFLSDRPAKHWHGRDLGPARRHDSLAWMGWALERTALVSCRQDYLDGHDMTIVMRHQHESHDDR